MGIRDWARRVLFLSLAIGLVGGAGCASSPPVVAKLPLSVEVENAGHLRVVVTGAHKRPLTAAELRPFEHGGFRWDYSVEFKDTAGVGAQLRQVQTTIRSLTGITTTDSFPLASRVEPDGTTPIQIHAVLSSSNPDEPGNVSGVQELIFLGWDDEAHLVRVVVRVPLE